MWQAYFESYNRLRNQIRIDFQLTPERFGEELSPGLKTLREALVNMLMHTDYFSPAHPRIRIFANHIEFFNPGCLPKPLQELKEKDLSIPRNPILAKFFRMVRLAENAGYGFDKMESNWKEYMDSEVIYEISFDSTIVAFPCNIRENNTTMGPDSNYPVENARRKYRHDSDKIRRDFG